MWRSISASIAAHAYPMKPPCGWFRNHYLAPLQVAALLEMRVNEARHQLVMPFGQILIGAVRRSCEGGFGK
jgi:hypothetical protein